MEKTRFKIDKEGKLWQTDKENDSFSDIKEAIRNRIYELDGLVDNDAELEVDASENNRNIWYATNYFYREELTKPVLDKNGNQVIAFQDIDRDILIECLNDCDVHYVE